MRIYLHEKVIIQQGRQPEVNITFKGRYMWSGIIYATLKEGIMGNIHVELYEIWTSGSGGDFVKIHFLSRALAAPLFSGLEPFVQFWKKAS